MDDLADIEARLVIEDYAERGFRARVSKGVVELYRDREWRREGTLTEVLARLAADDAPPLKRAMGTNRRR